MLHLFVASWFWHPLAEGHGSACSATDQSGCGYSFWSGGASDIGEVTLIFAVLAGIATFWRKHNCHVQGCWRLSWHAHPGHGHPVCRKHHPYGEGRGDHLRASHHRDHSHWPPLTVNPHDLVTSTVTPWSGNLTTTFGASVPYQPDDEPGDSTPRERKPGSPVVTDLDSKRKPDG